MFNYSTALSFPSSDLSVIAIIFCDIQCTCTVVSKLTFQCTVVTSLLHSWEVEPTGSWGRTIGESCDRPSPRRHNLAVESPDLGHAIRQFRTN